MGTRSTIAIEYSNGAIEQVYCHWDGYLSNNGKILLDHYMDPYKLRSLIDLGSLSSLRPEIGVQHPFATPPRFATPEWTEHREKYGNMCTFYGRDRGESNTEANIYISRDDYLLSNNKEEYDYLFVNGKWYVSDHGRPMESLEAALAEEQEEVV